MMHSFRNYIPLFKGSAAAKTQLYFPTLATEYLMGSQLLLHHKQPVWHVNACVICGLSFAVFIMHFSNDLISSIA